MLRRRQKNFVEKTGQKRRFWSLFGKLVYIGAERAFRKVLGYVTKNGYLKIVQRGDTLGRQGVESFTKTQILHAF